MGCSKYVGRVGALAVALGIGTAVAGPASADTHTTEPDGMSTESTQAPSPDPAAETGSASPGGDEIAQDEIVQDEIVQDEIVQDEGVPPAGEDDASQAIELVEDELEHVGIEDDLIVDVEIEDADGGHSEDAGNGDEEGDAIKDAPPTPELLTNTRQARPALTPAAAVQTDPDDDAGLRSQIHTAADLGAPAATITVTSIEPAVAQPNPVRSLVVGVLRLFGYDPLATTPGPIRPLTPVLELIWASYRRIESSLINSRPEAGTPQIVSTELVDGQVRVTGTLNFTDFNGDPLTYTATNGVTVDTNGVFTYTYTPVAGQPGSATFALTASDKGIFRLFDVFNIFKPGGGRTTTATVVLSIDAIAVPQNTPPVALAGELQNVSENSATTGSLANLVSDADADTLTLEVVDGPTVGTVNFISATGFRYTAPADFGTATSTTFTYRAFDGTAYSNVATVTINFAVPNEAPVVGSPAFTVTGTDTATGKVTGTLNVDDDGTLAYTVSGIDPSLGSVTLTSTGGFVFTPKGAARLAAQIGTGPNTASFTITASDGEFSVPVAVTVAVDAAEAAVTDTFTAGAQPSGIAVSADGSRLYVTNFSQGTVTIVDATTLAVIDARPLAPGINGITVGPNPTSVLFNGNRLYVANAGSNGGFGTISVVNTDTNVEIAVINVGNSPQTLALNGNRLYVVNLFDNTVSVVDTTTNTVIDTDGTTPGVNPISLSDAPRGIAVDGTRLYATNWTTDTVTVIDTTTFAVVAEISAGSDPYGVVVKGDRLYVSNFEGSVSVIDLSTNTSVGTIPVGTGASFLVADGNRLYVSNTFDNTVSVIDTTSNSVTETVGVGPLPGRLAISPDGSRVYVINSDGTISVIRSMASVPVNSAPVAYAGTLQNATENGTTTASLANLVIDADGDAVTLEVVTAPTIGTVTFISPTNFRYVAPAEIGAVTSTTFTYRAFDGVAYSNTAIVTINFINSNDAPTAVADAASTAEDTAVSIDVRANDADPESDALTVTVVGAPAHGSAALAADGRIVYTPEANYFGEDVFTYTVSDGFLSDTATVTVTVNPVEDAPVVESVVSTFVSATSYTVTVTAYDPDGGQAEVGLTANDPEHVTITPMDQSFSPFAARAFTAATAPQTIFEFLVTIDPEWALANPGAPIGVGLAVGDDDNEPATSAVTVGAVTNVLGVGSNYNGQLDIPGAPSGLSYVKIVTGQQSVALLSDGTAVVFGTDEEFPIEIPPLPAGLTYTDVAAGVFHVVLLRSDGQVITAGTNEGGQLDVPSLPDGLTYTAVAAGDLFTAVLRSDGVLIALGEDPSLQDWSLPALPDGLTYTQLRGGLYHLMALRSDGQVFVVGGGGLGEDDVPPLPTGLSYTAMAAGGAFSLLLRSDGQAFGFGYDYFGQSTVPVLPEGVTYEGVAAGTYHSVFLRSDGTAVAVGLNYSDGEYSIPELPAGVKYVGVSAGIASTILLTETI